MAASLAEIVIKGGIRGLCCPMTGKAVIDQEDGFDPEARHTPHLRFFVDWAGEIWAVDPADLPDDQADYMKKVVRIWANPKDDDNQNKLVARCLKALPESCVVFEILNPPAGSFDGEICYACFELDAPAKKKTVRVHEVTALEPDEGGSSRAPRRQGR